MKALSIREPWAGMIRGGKKTIETRTWRTKYRGLILLCCSRRPFISNLCGMAFATADLVACRKMTREDEHDAGCKVYHGAYSWILKDIQPIKKFPAIGKMGVFDIDVKKEDVIGDGVKE